ncbi:MAG: hypothetical protein WCS59_06165 [Sphaerochaetaceae bacterium]|jgi:hypothetical protein|nr:hypothetical protein [Sphaerochaetaceae bacterium]MDD4218611.1 hypothetical protein [Sphaerochaetaceae bacterium]MDY0371424.1 hypothetical protein [Sphaerochaetaceae bacterium]
MKKIGYIVIVLILASLLGCSSLSTWVRSNIEGVPAWVYEPQFSRNQKAFVGKGTAASETRARILAYESILTQISTYIGEDVVGLHIAELSTADTVAAYRLKITQEHVKIDADSITIYFLAIADNAVLETARTEAEVQMLEKQQEMDRYANQAAQAFRANKDVVAALAYLEIAMIANSLPVERGKQRYTGAINRMRDILSALQFSVLTGEPTVPTTTVTLRRGRRAISPRVDQAPIVVLSQARDGMGKYYQDRERFVTDQAGQITYNTSNPTLVSKGELVFAIDIEHELEALREIDPLVYSEFTELLRSKEVSYPYNRVSIIGAEQLLVSISEYNLQGELLPTSYATQSFMQEIKKDDIKSIDAHQSVANGDEDYRNVLRAQYPVQTFAIIGNTGISYTKQLQKGSTVTVSGEIALVNLKTGVRLGSSEIVTVNAIGTTYEEAEQQAFTKFGMVSAFLLYRFLFR